MARGDRVFRPRKGSMSYAVLLVLYQVRCSTGLSGPGRGGSTPSADGGECNTAPSSPLQEGACPSGRQSGLKKGPIGEKVVESGLAKESPYTRKPASSDLGPPAGSDVFAALFCQLASGMQTKLHMMFCHAAVTMKKDGRYITVKALDRATSTLTDPEHHNPVAAHRQGYWMLVDEVSHEHRQRKPECLVLSQVHLSDSTRAPGQTLLCNPGLLRHLCRGSALRGTCVVSTASPCQPGMRNMQNHSSSSSSSDQARNQAGSADNNNSGLASSLLPIAGAPLVLCTRHSPVQASLPRHLRSRLQLLQAPQRCGGHSMRIGRQSSGRSGRLRRTGSQQEAAGSRL